MSEVFFTIYPTQSKEVIPELTVIDKYCSNGTIINKRYFVDMKHELFFRCLERIFSNISI